MLVHFFGSYLSIDHGFVMPAWVVKINGFNCWLPVNINCPLVNVRAFWIRPHLSDFWVT